jgi:hypothetical protein
VKLGSTDEFTVWPFIGCPKGHHRSRLRGHGVACFNAVHKSGGKM